MLHKVLGFPHCNKGRKRKESHIDLKNKIKLLLFANGMIAYVENYPQTICTPKKL
jgi:hypothetical protein